VLPLEQRADLLAVLLARHVRSDSIVVMGTGTPLTAVATLLALSTHAPDAAYTSPLAGALSVVRHDITLATLEQQVFEHATVRSAQIIELWETSTINPKVAGRWLQFFRPAQMDATGNMNNSVIGPYDQPRVRLPGSVGISDMTAYYHQVFAYVTRHIPAAFPKRVDFVSAPGTLGSRKERQARGLRWGRPERVFTDLCVMEFDADGRLFVASLHPGVTLEEVREATSFDLDYPEPQETLAPTPEELGALAVIDPDGVRRLELLPSAQRREQLLALLRT
jgi:glutaconate CoA-transferase, subunit B